MGVSQNGAPLHISHFPVKTHKNGARHALTRPQVLLVVYLLGRSCPSPLSLLANLTEFASSMERLGAWQASGAMSGALSSSGGGTGGFLLAHARNGENVKRWREMHPDSWTKSWPNDWITVTGPSRRESLDVARAA